MRNYLSISCIAKDETSHIVEFINYHRLIGVDHFYIYDNESKIPLTEQLKDFIADGIVTVKYYPGKGIQVNACNDALHCFGPLTQWMAFIDVDEFIVPKTVLNLKDALIWYELYGGIGINWCVFGSSGHIDQPDDLQINSFTKRIPNDNPINNHIKSIVQPSKTIKVGGDPHHFIYHSPYFCVNESKRKIIGPFSDHQSELFQLNHYFTRSQSEFKIKMERGRADILFATKRVFQEFLDVDSASTQEDTEIINLINKLSK